MYQSRYHFDHGHVHIALDSLTGALLELDRHGEDLIKNSMTQIPQPFALVVNGVTVSAPDSRAAREDERLRAEICAEETDAGLRVSVSYRYLKVGDAVLPAQLSYTALLADEEITWQLDLENTFESTIDQVRFPILNGIWIGEDPADNYLYYPKYAGMRIKDPIHMLTTPPRSIGWRWQEYRYTYTISGYYPSAELSRRGLHGIDLAYPGGLCMSYLALTGADLGLYYGCHDPGGKPVWMEAAVIGEQDAGMCFAARFVPKTAPGDAYHSPALVTAFFDGDWHKAADRYRQFRKPHIPASDAHPAWVKKSAGLFAHYDFKWQNGGIVHRYEDIPALAKQALEAGVDHILLAGWHRDGFDNGFPAYETDPELGTPNELSLGIRTARAMGVHVSFYVNLRLHNRRYDTPARIDSMAIMREDGTIGIESYGDPKLKFSTMCPGSPAWQEKILSVVKRCTDEYGCDGFYFDQIGCDPILCFNPEHNHAFDGWNDGYVTLLQRIRASYDPFHAEPLNIMGEWTVDRFGELMDLQLNQTFYYLHIGGYPEMFRYTFPEFGVVDMLYPGKNLAMRPVHIAQRSRDLMGHLFTNGSYFWIYDLVDDNTFDRDPAGKAELSGLISLVKLRKSLTDDASYSGDAGLIYDENRLYCGRFGDVLALYAKEDGVVLSPNHPGSAMLYTPDGACQTLPAANELSLPRGASLLRLL